MVWVQALSLCFGYSEALSDDQGGHTIKIVVNHCGSRTLGILNETRVGFAEEPHEATWLGN